MSKAVHLPRPPYVLGARRRRRVSFDATVRLRDPVGRRSVPARTANISESGLLVTAREVPAPGAEIECAFLVGDDERILRGQVVWSRPGGTRGARAAAGIEFRDLGRDDRRLLTTLVESIAREQTVVADVAGPDGAFRADAAVMGEEVHLRVPLPALGPGTPVDVAFQHRGVGERRAGRVQEIVLHVGENGEAPALLLKVATPRPAEAGGTIEVRAQPAVPPLLFDDSSVVIEAEPPAPSPSVQERRERGRADRFFPPAMRRANRVASESPPWRGLLIGSSLLASLTLGAFALYRGRGRATPELRRQPPEGSPRAGFEALPPTRPAVRPPSAGTRSRPPRPAPAVREPTAMAGDLPVPPIVAQTHAGRTTVSIPLAEVPSSFTHYPRESPVVDVVVNLSDGGPFVDQGSYRIGQGSVTTVRVLRRGRGTQLRFGLARPGLRHKVTVQGGALVLTVDEPVERSTL